MWKCGISFGENVPFENRWINHTIILFHIPICFK
jgi:hypothetical protein